MKNNNVFKAICSFYEFSIIIEGATGMVNQIYTLGPVS